MKIWITSDQHLQNERIWSVYQNDTRPFHSQGEHDTMIIHHWNSVVSPDDLVFVLGDFIMGASENVESLLYRLNGTIFLVRGNHDTDSKIEITMKIFLMDVSFTIYTLRVAFFANFADKE